MPYEPIIGMEIHIEVKTDSKMFCSCASNPDETVPNKNVCPICLGHPGTLPAANKKAVEYTIKTAFSLFGTKRNKDLNTQKIILSRCTNLRRTCLI